MDNKQEIEKYLEKNNFKKEYFKEKIILKMTLYCKKNNDGKYTILLYNQKDNGYYNINSRSKISKIKDIPSKLKKMNENMKVKDIGKYLKDFKKIDIFSYNFRIFFNKSKSNTIGDFKILIDKDFPDVLKKYQEYYKCSCDKPYVPGGFINLYLMGRRIGKNLILYGIGDSYHSRSSILLYYDNKKLAEDIGLNMNKSQDEIKIIQFQKWFYYIQKKCLTMLHQKPKDFKKYYTLPTTYLEYMEKINKKKKNNQELTKNEKEKLNEVREKKNDNKLIKQLQIYDNLEKKEKLKKIPKPNKDRIEPDLPKPDQKPVIIVDIIDQPDDYKPIDPPKTDPNPPKTDPKPYWKNFNTAYNSFQKKYENKELNDDQKKKLNEITKILKDF